jgi:hypothetical protein
MPQLFLPPVDPHSFFEKQASIAKMPDDDTKWPAHVLSNLHRQLPFLSQYDVDIDMQRVEPEAGFAFGHALLMSRNDPSAATSSKNPQNMVRIPIIVADRLLQPFHTFELGGNVYPLTAERIEASLLNPAMFQGPADQPQRQKSLIDQMYPPYQQRQGFGRVVGDGASSMGINKLSSAPDETATRLDALSMDPKKLTRLAELRKTEAKDRFSTQQGFMERTKDSLKGLALPVGVGLTLGGYRGGRAARAAGKSVAEGALAGVKASGKTSGAITAANMSLKEYNLNKRQKDRESFGLPRVGTRDEDQVEKAAAATLTFGPGNRVPASVVLSGQKIKAASGVNPASLVFYSISGTPYVAGVPESVARKLEAEKDQKALGRIIAPLMKAESDAHVSGRLTPGMFLLFYRDGNSYKRVAPAMGGAR